MAAENAQTLITAAIGQGYAALSARQLKECLLYAVGNGGGGGGGGGSGAVDQGEGAPTDPPAAPLEPAVYVDLSTNYFYTWNVTEQTWVISSTGGSAQISQGNGAPVNPPGDPTLAAVYTDLDTGTFYAWRIVDQEWF